MSRTIKEIYNQAVKERNKRLELNEFSNDSKMSIMNGLTWVVATIIQSFETILDIFAIDISTTINNRINGTPIYYANAMLSYQKGDEIIVREDGLAFGYANVDETKRIITQVSYTYNSNNLNIDEKLILKIATGVKGKLQEVSEEDLILINSYIRKIKFVGTHIEVTSRKGDILIPRLSVYYDGAVMESIMYDAIDEKLNEYIMNIDFDAAIYVSKIIEAIRKAEHVTDVYIDETANPQQGVFLACYDADGKIQSPQKVTRMMYTTSGYVKESTRSGVESNLPNFRQSIKLIVDNG